MSDRSTPLRVLVVTNMYPTPQTPAFGAFVETEVNAIRRLDGGAAAVVELVFVNGREHLAAYLRAPYQIREIVRRRNIDVVHAHYGLTGFVAAFHDVPLVVTFHGDDLWGTRTPSGGISTKSRVARWFSYSVASRADAIICHSEELRSALPRAADRARAHVIPMGVDTNRFTPGKREAARQRLGQPTDQRLVLFPVSAMQPVKRLD
ncbi:MAG TPA: glycosyltransferase, partial [Gemmatimonadales bacterium]|nr:glycosyltransferase [Gemmatimonadales bacterium]